MMMAVFRQMQAYWLGECPIRLIVRMNESSPAPQLVKGPNDHAMHDFVRLVGGDDPT